MHGNVLVSFTVSNTSDHASVLDIAVVLCITCFNVIFDVEPLICTIMCWYCTYQRVTVSHNEDVSVLHMMMMPILYGCVTVAYDEVAVINPHVKVADLIHKRLSFYTHTSHPSGRVSVSVMHEYEL